MSPLKLLQELANQEPQLDRIVDKLENIEFSSLETAEELLVAQEKEDYQYSDLAARLHVYQLRKKCLEKYPTFSTFVAANEARLEPEFVTFVTLNADAIDSIVDHSRDSLWTLAAVYTLVDSYLIGDECPQYMWMRVACAIHSTNKCRKSPEEYIDSLNISLQNIRTSYDMFSRLMMTQATPTIYNAGLKRGSFHSCFLNAYLEDSVEEMGQVVADSMMLHKSCGGVATAVSRIRARGSLIKSVNRTSDGSHKFLHILKEVSEFIDQGRRRPGKHAIYLEPWHLESLETMERFSRHKTTDRCLAGMHLALWCPDYFFQCVDQGLTWYLVCPSHCPGLDIVFFDEFRNKLLTHVAENKDKIVPYEEYRRGRNFDGIIVSIPAREYMNLIIESLHTTGGPYILNKDQCNAKSNQNNIGPILSSNLCAEVIEAATFEHLACCCLGSIRLSAFLHERFNLDGEIVRDFDESGLRECVRQMTINLNQVLDKSYYYLERVQNSARDTRAIGIGLQDLEAVRMYLRIDPKSAKWISLAAQIQEIVYYEAMSTSCELAKKDGPYDYYQGSRASEGLLQFDLWKFNESDRNNSLYSENDWKALRERIQKFGLRNSEITCNMPTGSTSVILGSTVESVEPLYSNWYTRKIGSGEFVTVNRYLIDDLRAAGWWNSTMYDVLLQYEGLIGKLTYLPEDLRRNYATVYETGMKPVIDRYAAMARFVSMSQSMNVFITDRANNSSQKLYSAIMYAWKQELKTLVYYFRYEKENLRAKDMNRCENGACSA